MSFIRPIGNRRFSDSTDSMYVWQAERGIVWDSGDPADPEDFLEVAFRIMAQGGVDVDLEMVNAARSRLDLDALDEIPDLEIQQDKE